AEGVESFRFVACGLWFVGPAREHVLPRTTNSELQTTKQTPPAFLPVFNHFKQRHLRKRARFANSSTMDTTADFTARAVVRRVPGVDPRRTEALLQAQDGVLDASVWFHEGDLA